jgi:choice-of-anchor B domain-containing protein
MKKFLIAFFGMANIAFAQTNISFLGQLDYNAFNGDGLSNLWGYTDEFGTEYAIVGTTDGVSIVDLSNPSNPTQIFYEAGSNTMWREVKTFNDYAYISTEASDGLMIIDLSPLPGSTALPVTYFHGPTGNQWQTAHSLFIDENGILYLHGTDRGNGGVIFYDLNTSPTNPAEVGEFDSWYVHDSYARGDTLYAAHINDGFFTIVDVSNKANPVLLGIQNTPHDFTHNTWLSDNGQFLFTTDEVSGAFVGSYDISDPTDIKEVDRIQHDPGTGVIPHNTYFLNDYLFTSYYRSGVTVHDAKYPDMLVEVAHFDTSPFAGDGFNGAWGVYCFFNSGNIIISDMEEGLFVLAPSLQRGCYLNGTVTDASNSQIIAGASIEILTENISDNTNSLGNYGTGILTPGNYAIRYAKPGYYPDTIFNVSLMTDIITTQNVALTPLPSFTFSGHIQDNSTLIGIANAQVEIKDAQFTYTATTDANGDFTINPFYDGIYDLSAGHWGHVTLCSSGNNFTSANSNITIGLDAGIYDDFTFDFGWTVSGGAPRGIWERAIPEATTQGADFINANEDVPGDCSDYAFVTGNTAGGSAGFDDVDSLSTILTSPVFDLSGYTDPYIFYARWFANKYSTNAPNDSLQIFVSNGTNTELIEFCIISNTTQSSWIYKDFKVSDFLTPTSTMQISVKLADWQWQGGNLAEGGFDYFYVSDAANSVSEIENNTIRIYPNPSNGNFRISTEEKMKEIALFDLSGRLVFSGIYEMNETDINLTDNFSNGIYTLMITFENGNKIPSKIFIKK